MRVHTAQGGGGSLPLNLHVQPDEPAIKEGLWIQAPAKETVKRVINKSSFVIGGTFADSGVPFAAKSDEGWFYVKRGKYIYYLDYFCANGDSSGYLAFYIDRYDITTKTKISAKLFETSYGTGLSKNLCYFYIKDDATLVFYLSYQYGNGNYPGVCGTLNLNDFSTVTTTAPSTGLPLSSLNSTMIYLGEDDTSVYFLYRYYNGSCYLISLDAIAKATGTGSALKQLYSSSDQLTNAGVWGILVEGIVYYALQSSTVLHMLNISDLTETTVTMPTTVFVNSEYLRWAIYQNSLYIPANANTILVFDTITKTFSQITVSNPPVTQELFVLFEDADNKRLLCAFVAGSKLFYYNFESESLPENTLAVLDGAKYNVKLITSATMNFLRAVFNDAWWYSDNFNEYPTYIGDGSQWNKIKN